MRVAQALCPACRPIAARRNAAAEEFNKLRDRHVALLRRVSDGYREYADAEGELARFNQLAVVNEAEADKRNVEKLSRQRRNNAILNGANAAQDEAKKVEEQMKAKAAEVEKIDAELLACEQKPCERPQTAQPRQAPQPVRTVTPVPAGGLLARQPNIATLIFEAGGLNVSAGASSINCPACPGSGSQGVSPTGNFAGADLRFNLLALFSALNLPPVPFAENVIMTGPFAGFRLRRYFNYKGDVVAFDFHPTAGNDTSLGFDVAWAYKTYIGLGFLIANPFAASQVAAIGLSPYVGVNVERGKVRLRTDESGGGGVNNNIERDVTRSGFAYGLDVDFYMRNLPFFVGLGLQWDRVPETTIDATTTALGLAYRGVIPGRTAFTAAFRVGVPLGGSR
ncbi:MAG: hypothetical protein FJX62_11185 [Alphaproteobacteria bacterium]|nr:hypothetical protein [Alphaproteobacteria bacterium]